jgi:hypothetical protein
MWPFQSREEERISKEEGRDMPTTTLTQAVGLDQVILEVWRAHNGRDTRHHTKTQNHGHGALSAGRHLQLAHDKKGNSGKANVGHDADGSPGVPDVDDHHKIAAGPEEGVPVRGDGAAVQKRRQDSNDGHDGRDGLQRVENPPVLGLGRDGQHRKEDGGLDERHGEAIENVGE